MHLSYDMFLLRKNNTYIDKKIQVCNKTIHIVDELNILLEEVNDEF